MRALVTGTRMPVALDMIRKLARSGDTVFAADTFAGAPGNHSRQTTRAFAVASPVIAPDRFAGDMAGILSNHRIDRVVPSFEEVFHLARHRDRLAPLAELFLSDLETLRLLHDKIAFLEFARDLDIAVHPHLVARSRAELAEACGAFQPYIARAAYSRGAVEILTNAGPLAGRFALEDCHPTPQNPFLVQPFVPGQDLCTSTIAHHGRVAAHVAYVHPLTMEHGGGISFESVDAPGTLPIAQRICDATGFNGQLSLDFMKTARGLVLIECNPRPTSGVALMPDAMFIDALNDRCRDRVLIGPAGVRRKMALVILRNMIVHPSGALRDMRALFNGGRDLFLDGADVGPLIYQVLAYGRVFAYRWKNRAEPRSDTVSAYLHDIVWNGEGI